MSAPPNKKSSLTIREGSSARDTNRTWRRIYKRLNERLEAAGVTLNDIFKVRQVCDNKKATRPEQFDWVEHQDVRKAQTYAQIWFDFIPGTAGPFTTSKTGYVTKRSTLDWIWQHREDPEAFAACWLLATAENYRRSHPYQEKGAPQLDPVLLSKLKDAARSRISELIEWHPTARSVMPIFAFDGEKYSMEPVSHSCRTMPRVVDALADELIGVMSRECAVVFSFSEEADPKIRSVLDKEYPELDREDVMAFLVDNPGDYKSLDDDDAMVAEEHEQQAAPSL